MQLQLGVDRAKFFDNTNHVDVAAFEVFYLSQGHNAVPDYAQAKIANTWVLLERVAVGTWEIRGTLNEEGSAGAPINVVPVPPTTPVTRTTTRSRPTGSGTIAAGARVVTVVNIGVADGTLDGVALERGATFEYPLLALGEVYEAIAFDATGTTFDVLEVR